MNIAAALNGIGLAYVAEPLVWKEIEDGSLETVLEEYLPMTPGVFMYFPSRSQAMPKLRAFIDHMRAALVEFERSMPRRVLNDRTALPCLRRWDRDAVGHRPPLVFAFLGWDEPKHDRQDHDAPGEKEADH